MSRRTAVKPVKNAEPVYKGRDKSVPDSGSAEAHEETYTVIRGSEIQNQDHQE